MNDQGLVVVVSAPSGAGKTTLCQEIVQQHRDCVFSVSVTTRPKRQAETEGKDYYFVSEPEFKDRIEKNQLAEWAVVHGHYYGTMKHTIQEIIDNGRTVILDIDVQGGLQIKQYYPEAVMIFILPPSFTELQKRLESRQTESPEQIAQRITNAKGEMEKAGEYTYLIINDQLAPAVADFQAILAAEKCRLKRQTGTIDQFVNNIK